jgi:hypothetical protein
MDLTFFMFCGSAFQILMEVMMRWGCDEKSSSIFNSILMQLMWIQQFYAELSTFA